MQVGHRLCSSLPIPDAGRIWDLRGAVIVMNRPTARTLRFVLLTGVCLAILLWPWSSVQHLYGSIFERGCALVVAPLAGEIQLEVQAQPPPAAPDRVMIDAFRRRGGDISRILINGRRTGYSPLAILLALVLATPISRWRRLRALVIGGLLVNAFVVLRVVALALLAQASFLNSHAGPDPGFLASDGWISCVKAVSQMLIAGWVGTLVPVMIWLAVCIRIEDLPPAVQHRLRIGTGAA